MGELFGLDGQVMCTACLAPELEVRALRNEPRDAFPLTDPTICSQCRVDNGGELPQMSGFPVCALCTDRVRDRPFPDWLKNAAVGLLLLGSLSLLYHRRYLGAYVEMAKANRALQRQDLAAARVHWDRIERLLPADRGAAATAAFFRGLSLLRENRSADALAELQKAKAMAGGNPAVDANILQAEAGVAFDRKDYDTFLAKSEALLETAPDEAMALGAVASGYACKFATGGDEKHRQEAERRLERGRTLKGGDSEQYRSYEERIRYRLRTREIIDADEYDRRFPPQEAKP